ncbi:MAG: hypothetical protein U5N26_02410 [Candidatus Marinimicrobia bacterium]|nr:hypothetical protein [Candidatus Neomarinimicrobiota bacterium]
MMQFIRSYFVEIYRLLLEMAPDLLLGFLIAGLISVLLPDDFFLRGPRNGRPRRWIPCRDRGDELSALRDEREKRAFFPLTE